jgi:hypothetical protein
LLPSFKINWLSNYLTLRVPNETCSGNTSCALNLTTITGLIPLLVSVRCSGFSILDRTIIFLKRL